MYPAHCKILSIRTGCLKSVSQSQRPMNHEGFYFTGSEIICFSDKVKKTAKKPAGSSFMHKTGIQPLLPAIP